MRSPRDLASQTIQRYYGDAERPVRGYAVVLGTYTAIVSVLRLVGRARGVRVRGYVVVLGTYAAILSLLGW